LGAAPGLRVSRGLGLKCFLASQAGTDAGTTFKLVLLRAAQWTPR